jgi:hypothetical protein
MCKFPQKKHGKGGVSYEWGKGIRPYKNILLYTTIGISYIIYHYFHLVGGIPTPLKNISSSVGIMKFPILIWKVNPNYMVPVTTSQPCFINYY